MPSQGDSNEEIYMAIPHKPNHAYKLLKFLYGLKQASRQMEHQILPSPSTWFYLVRT